MGHIRKESPAKVFLFISLMLGAPRAHAALEITDACQEIYFQSCQQENGHLNEGSNPTTLPEFATVAQALVPEVKADLVQVLRQRVASPEVREAMVRRIMEAKVKIELGSAEMSYNPEENQVHAGMLFFQEDRSEQRRNFSLFSFVQAVGHELAHSIDPCNATKTIGGRHPAFLRVERRTLAQAIESYPIRALSCLASPASVGIGAPSMGDATRTQNGAELCRKIRLSETFADYMAAEVLSLFAQKVAPILTRQQLINGFANIYSLTCHAKYTPQSGGEAVHPNVATRVAWIMLSHESIRQQLGCAPSAIERPYCR